MLFPMTATPRNLSFNLAACRGEAALQQQLELILRDFRHHYARARGKRGEINNRSAHSTVPQA